jgi:hypothetical protein
MRPMPQWPCTNCQRWQLLVPNAVRATIEWTAGGPAYLCQVECPDCDHVDDLHVDRRTASLVVLAFTNLWTDKSDLRQRFHSVLREGGLL